MVDVIAKFLPVDSDRKTVEPTAPARVESVSNGYLIQGWVTQNREIGGTGPDIVLDTTPNCTTTAELGR